MSMPLHSRIAKDEWDEMPRFDFLKGLQQYMIRMDEVHPSVDNDTYYIFLIWIDYNKIDSYKFRDKLEANYKKTRDCNDWRLDAAVCGEGFIFVSTWL